MNGPGWPGDPVQVAGPPDGPPDGLSPLLPGAARGRRGTSGAGDQAPVAIAVQLGRIQIILWLATGSLITLNLLIGLTTGLKLLPYTLTRFFDGNDRGSLLSGIETTLLLVTTLLMSCCAAAARRRGVPGRRGWRALAVVGALLFVDSATHSGRSLAVVVRERFDLQGPMSYAGAVVYLPLVLVALWALAGDLRTSPVPVGGRLLPGGVLYLLGAIGAEPVASANATEGPVMLGSRLVVAAGDSARLVGLTLVLSAVLVAASRLAAGFTLVLARSEPLGRALAGPRPRAARGDDPRP